MITLLVRKFSTTILQMAMNKDVAAFTFAARQTRLRLQIYVIEMNSLAV